MLEKNKPKIVFIPNRATYLINESGTKKMGNLVKSKGESFETVSGVVLCRCETSKNKPFFDGEHNSVNFLDEDN